MTSIGLSHAQKIPLADLTTPRTGTYRVYVDYWWASVLDDAGQLMLLIYRGGPQCNQDEALMRRMTAELWPGAEPIQIPVAYLKHTCTY
jgi:hypothetical protein